MNRWVLYGALAISVLMNGLQWAEHWRMEGLLGQSAQIMNREHNLRNHALKLFNAVDAALTDCRERLSTDSLGTLRH